MVEDRVCDKHVEGADDAAAASEGLREAEEAVLAEDRVLLQAGGVNAGLEVEDLLSGLVVSGGEILVLLGPVTRQRRGGGGRGILAQKGAVLQTQLLQRARPVSIRTSRLPPRCCYSLP